MSLETEEYIKKLMVDLEKFNNDALMSISSLCCGIIKFRREQKNIDLIITQLNEELQNDLGAIA